MFNRDPKVEEPKDPKYMTLITNDWNKVPELITPHFENWYHVKSITSVCIPGSLAPPQVVHYILLEKWYA